MTDLRRPDMRRLADGGLDHAYYIHRAHDARAEAAAALCRRLASFLRRLHPPRASRRRRRRA